MQRYTWYDIVLKDYDEADPMCTEAITKTIAAITQTDPAKLVKPFHTCDAAAFGDLGDAGFFVYALEGQWSETPPKQPRICSRTLMR